MECARKQNTFAWIDGAPPDHPPAIFQSDRIGDGRNRSDGESLFRFVSEPDRKSKRSFLAALLHCARARCVAGDDARARTGNARLAERLVTSCCAEDRFDQRRTNALRL